MTDKQTQSLNSLVDTRIKYEGRLYDITNFKETQRNIVVFSKQRSFVLQHQELDNWLESVKILETKEFDFPSIKQPEETEKVSLQIFEPTQAQKDVQEALLDILKKVKTDPAIIPQAKAVCEIANTMVNMEKTQIQLINLAKRRN